MKKKKAFTLLELMVAMGIIAVLVTMSIVGIQIVQTSLRNTERRDVLNTFNLYLAGYYNDNGFYPADGSVTVTTAGILVDGTVVVEADGATTPAATTDNDGTAYCYSSSDGGSYSLGASLENNTFGDGGGLQLGNSGTDCTTAETVGGGGST